MTDRHDEPRDADDLADRVSGLGDTAEDALEEVAGRNASLEERLPDEDLGNEGELPRGEGAPGQG